MCVWTTTIEWVVANVAVVTMATLTMTGIKEKADPVRISNFDERMLRLIETFESSKAGNGQCCLFVGLIECSCMCVCECVRARARVRACVCVCVHARARPSMYVFLYM